MEEIEMKYGTVVYTITGEKYIGEIVELTEDERNDAITFFKKIDKITQISLNCIDGSFMSFRGENVVALKLYKEEDSV
jgi:hypothetical protein